MIDHIALAFLFAVAVCFVVAYRWERKEEQKRIQREHDRLYRGAL